MKDRRDPAPGDSLAANDTTPGGTVPQSVPRAELAPPPLASNAAGHLSRILLAGNDMAEHLRWSRIHADLTVKGREAIDHLIDEWRKATAELAEPEPLASRKAPE